MLRNNIPIRNSAETPPSLDKLTSDQRKLKGEATRERLVIEAINLFGKKGYKGTNTRALAEAAECNLGLITFHFGGKMGLYNVAITRVKNRLREMMAPSIELLERSTLDQNLSKKELYERTIKSMESLSESLLGMEQIAGHALLLLREFQDNTENASSTYVSVFSPLLVAIEKALDKATSYKDPLKARLTAFIIINASLEFLRNYPIFYPPESTQKNMNNHNINNLPIPSMPYVLRLLTSHLLPEMEFEE